MASLTCHQGHVSDGVHLPFSTCKLALPGQLDVPRVVVVTSAGRGPMSAQYFDGTGSKIGDM